MVGEAAFPTTQVSTGKITEIPGLKLRIFFNFPVFDKKTLFFCGARCGYSLFSFKQQEEFLPSLPLFYTTKKLATQEFLLQKKCCHTTGDIL